MGWFEDNLSDPPGNGTPGMDSGRVNYGDFVTRPPLGTATGGGLNGPTAGALNPVTPPKTTTATTTNPTTGGGRPTLNVNDPASIRAYVAWMGQQPGVNPSVANDPDYWFRQISSGHLGGDESYISGKMFTQDGGPSAWGGGGTMTGAFGPPPAWQDYTAPGMGPNVPDIPDYQAPEKFTYGEYDAPDPFSFDPFQKPDPAAVAADPSYQFRLNEGERALQASASARGTLRTGGTLKDINAWAQDFATQEYDKIYGRAMDEWRQKYDTSMGAYTTNANVGLGAYNANRANAADIYKTNADVGYNAWNANSGKAMDLYNANYGQFQDSVKNNQFATTTNNAGRMGEWAAKYGMSQDEINNLIKYAGIGANAAAGTPSGRA